MNLHKFKWIHLNLFEFTWIYLNLLKFTWISQFEKNRLQMDQQTDRRTDQRTDRQTDRRTDRPSYRDARTHLKMLLAGKNFVLRPEKITVQPQFSRKHFPRQWIIQNLICILQFSQFSPTAHIEYFQSAKISYRTTCHFLYC